MNCISGPNQTKLNNYRYPRDKNTNQNNKLNNRGIKPSDENPTTQPSQSLNQKAHLIITQENPSETTNSSAKEPNTTDEEINIKPTYDHTDNPTTKTSEITIKSTNIETNESEQQQQNDNKTTTINIQPIKENNTMIKLTDEILQKLETSPKVEQTDKHSQAINQIKNEGPIRHQTEKLSHTEDEYIKPIKPGIPTTTHNPLSHNQDKTIDNQINIQPNTKYNGVTHIPQIDKETPASEIPAPHPVTAEINELKVCNQNQERSDHITIQAPGNTVNKPETSNHHVSNTTSTSTSTMYETGQSPTLSKQPSANTHIEATPTKQQPRPPEEHQNRRPATRNNIYPQQDNIIPHQKTNNNAELKNQYNPSLQTVQETKEETKRDIPTTTGILKTTTTPE